MKAFVGVTDFDWFEYLSKLPQIDEVNFWQPGGNQVFRALNPSEPFLFKLHSPRDYKETKVAQKTTRDKSLKRRGCS